MSKIVVKKVCQFCGKEFIAHKLNTIYCSHQYSQRSYKVRLRVQKLEKVVHQENLPDISPTTLKKEYLSCEDVAELMGISSTTVYRYRITGKIKCITINRKIFIRKEDINATFRDFTTKSSLFLAIRRSNMTIRRKNRSMHADRSKISLSLRQARRYLRSLKEINEASFLFLARLFVYLMQFD